MKHNMLDWTLRVSSALCLGALSVLSWTPGQYIARTGLLTGHQEHCLAYLLAAAIVVATIAKSIGLVHAALALVAYAAVLELGQYLVPGRSPAFDDFFSSALGALTGIAVVWFVGVRWTEDQDPIMTPASST